MGILSDRPVPQLPTSDAGPRCGKWLFVIAKVQAGLPLSVVERDFVADVLREGLFTKKEWKAYQHWKFREHVDQVRRIAPYAVRHGQREDFVQSVFGKTKATLIRRYMRWPKW